MAMEVVATKAADLVEAHSVLPGMPPTGLLGAKAMEGAFLMDEEDEECLEAEALRHFGDEAASSGGGEASLWACGPSEGLALGDRAGAA